MSYQNPETHEVYVGEVVDPTPATKYGLGALISKRSARAMMEDAAYTAGNNRCRALIVKSAMEEAGTLAFVAKRISCMTPQATEICQQLLAAYGEKAIEAVRRW